MEINNLYKSVVPRFYKAKSWGWIALILLMVLPQAAEAQCAMCRAVLETEGDSSIAEGMNNGIVYLMALPYVLVGGVFFAIYYKMRPKGDKNSDTPQ